MTRPRTFLIFFNIATVLLWAAMVLEFLSQGTFLVPNTLPELYLIILGYYVGDKEVRRWRRRYQAKRQRGELFVIGWTATIMIMMAVDLLGGSRYGYRLPGELPLVVSGVVAMYVITEYLKSEFKK